MSLLLMVLLCATAVGAGDVPSAADGSASQGLLGWLIEQIQGNALWDVVKWLGQWAWMMPIALAYFLSPRLRMFFFCRFNGLKPIFDDPYAWNDARRVRNEKRIYTPFESKERETTIKGLFPKNGAKYGGVYVLMGPLNVGKRTLLFANGNPWFHVFVSIPHGRWQSGDLEKPVDERLFSKLFWLLLGVFWRKHLFVCLDWDSQMSLPSQEMFEGIVGQLGRYLDKSYRARKHISFVLRMPGYYRTDTIQSKQLAAYDVNLLNCSECRSFTENAIRRMEEQGRDGGVDLRKELERRAASTGVTTDRLLWVSSLGRPRHLLGLLNEMRFANPEVWIKLVDWWARAYPDVHARKRWLVAIYYLALLANGERLVRIPDLAEILSLDVNLMMAALKILCKESELVDDVNHFNSSKFDPRILFVDDYVWRTLILSLGSMRVEQGGRSINVLGFRDELVNSFETFLGRFAKDSASMDRICNAYADAVSVVRRPVDRLERALELSDEVGKILGAQVVSERIKDMVLGDGGWSQALVDELQGKVGSVNTQHLFPQIESLVRIYHDHIPAEKFADKVLRIVQIGILAKKLPHFWGVDFYAVTKEAIDMGLSEGALYTRAVLAMLASYSNDVFIGEISYAPERLKTIGQIKGLVDDQVLPLISAKHREFLSLLGDLVRIVATPEGNPDGDLQDFSDVFLRSELAFRDGTPAERTALLGVVSLVRWNVPGPVVNQIDEFLNRLDCNGVEGCIWDAAYDGIAARYDESYGRTLSQRISDLDEGVRALSRGRQCPIDACRSLTYVCEYIRNVAREGGDAPSLTPYVESVMSVAMDLCSALNRGYVCKVLVTLAQMLSPRTVLKMKEHFALLWKKHWDVAFGPQGVDDMAEWHYYVLGYSNISNSGLPIQTRMYLLGEARVPAPFLEGVFFSDYLEAVLLISDDMFPPVPKLCYLAQLASMTKANDPLPEIESAEAAERALAEVVRNNPRRVSLALIEKFFERARHASDAPAVPVRVADGSQWQML